MSDQSGLQTCEASGFAQADGAELSRSSLTAAADAVGQIPLAPKKAALEHSSLAFRIHDNLSWAHAFNPQTSPFPPVDVWHDIKPLWEKSDKEFVTGLFEVLLGRTPETQGLEKACEVLAGGASRVAMARIVALSDEAAASQLDLSWLFHLDEMESDEVWEKVQSLWDKPDQVFVANLYPLLLVRAPDKSEVTAHCRAMKKGASRACVVRAFALSDEARLRRLSTTWLSRLEILPPPSPPSPVLSLRWLKTAFRRWRNGKKTASDARSRDGAGTLQPVGAAAKGGRA